MGVTVENQNYVYRIANLRKTGARIKFISFYPFLSKIDDLNFKSIDWIIVGGESCPGARPVQEEWLIQLKDLCVEQGKPFFFKQWGGFHKKKKWQIVTWAKVE